MSLEARFARAVEFGLQPALLAGALLAWLSHRDRPELFLLDEAVRVVDQTDAAEAPMVDQRERPAVLEVQHEAGMLRQLVRGIGRK